MAKYASFLHTTLIILILVMSGCHSSSPSESSPTSTPTEPTAPSTPTRPPSLTKPAGESERHCGDGVCDGPETAENCPQDCAAPTSEAQPTPTSAAVEEIEARPGEEPGTYWVTNPTSGVELFTTVMRPDDWRGEPLPTLVIIPGGTDDSAGLTESGSIGPKAVARGYAVVTFDADGRGRSGGEESYSGFTHQDGLAAVIQFAAGLSEVDAERMGLMSFSYGVTLGSGVLARYPELPIRFFIDWEGPADRRDTTIGCKPSPKYDWPACDDDAAWAEREALTFVGQIQVPYQRVQNQRDHVQPDVSHAIHMVNAAVAGPSPWVRLNDYPPNQTYDPDDPPAMLPNRSETSLDQRMLDYAEEMFEMTGETTETTSDTSAPPVYVTVAGHIEDVPIYTNCDVYPQYREKLLRFAEAIAAYDVPLNLQIDYEFFQGVSQCETEALRANTDGQNVLAYLVERYGYEIDAHQEGGWEEWVASSEGKDNYADVRFLGEQVVPSISDIVGGLVWDDAEQFARLAGGEAGWLYPDFTWYPQILTLAVSRDHHLGDFSRDDLASGIWRPRGAGQDFWAHDPGGALIYVGPGEHANWDADRPWLSTPDFVQAVADQLEQGALDRDKMYTASIAVPQSVIFKPERYPDMLALLDQLAPLVESGRATYVTYSQAVEIWRTAYDAQPNVFFREGVEPPSTGASSPSGNKEDAPLYLTTMTHLEGDFKDDQNEDIFRLHVEQLRYGLKLANEYGAKFTIESEMPFARACETWGLNALQEVLDLGHGVGTHCDVGFRYTPESPSELARLYRERKTLVDALVGPEHNRGYSGGGSEQDWILAAQEAGFAYKDGGVGMLYLSMPLENRPGPQWTDEYIRSTAFHNPAPVELEQRIYPFMMADAQDFVPDADGVILFSGGGIGRLDSMVEGGPTNCPQMNCPFTEEDVELIVAQIREVDRIRDRSRIAKANIYIPLKLFGEQHEAAWRTFFEQVQTLEQQGVVTWATQGEVYDAYWAWGHDAEGPEMRKAWVTEKTREYVVLEAQTQDVWLWE